MLRALIAGEASPEAMADLARGQLRRKRDDLILALDGRLEEHHRFLLAMQMRRLKAIEADIATADPRIDERLEPYRAPHTLLMQMPGVDGGRRRADRGDWRRHERVRERLSFVGLGGVCPGNHESAGRRKSGRARKGNIHLRTILVSAAISASRVKGSCLKDKYHCLKAHRGGYPVQFQ